MKKNCLYEREVGCWVEYEEEVYKELRHMRQRVCIRMRRQHQCVCPLGEQWRCNGVCEGCSYRKSEDVSLDNKLGESEDLTYGSVLTDGVDYEEMCAEKLHSKAVLERLDEIMPQARVIGEMRLKGVSDREIAKAIGISRTSMYRLLVKVQAILLEEFEEI